MDYKHLLNTCFEYSDNLFIILSKNFTIKSINTAVEKILKWDKKDVINRKINRVFIDYNTQPFIDLNHKKIQAKNHTSVVSNERNLKISWDIIPLKNYEFILIVGKNEEDLTEQLDGIQLEHIVKYAPGLFYWKDKNSVYQGCNDEFATLAGLKSRADVKGKTDYDLAWKDRAKLYIKTDSKVIKTGKAKLNQEEVISVSNNKTITAITNKVPLFDNKNQVIGVLGITTDITHQKQVEHDLNIAKEQAEIANRAKTEFIANMSHDIRTPLTGVVGMSKMLEDNAIDPNQKNYAHWLGESGDQLLHMLNGILEVVSADSANELDLREECFDIRRIIQDIVELERPSTLLKGIELLTHVDPNVPIALISDHTKLHRILLNLLGNAIKFTQTGHVKIELSLLKKNKSHATIRFQVVDTGIGIPIDMQDKVFERFFRVTPSYKDIYTGHGVGLHIAQSYAHLLGSKIKLVSVYNKGTTFYFDLSLKIGDQLMLESPSSPVVNWDIHGSSQFNALLNYNTTGITINLDATIPKVLLVEDNSIALRVLESVAMQAECQFISALDGESALDIVHQNKLDLIITDLGLPGLSGIELTRSIREFEKTAMLKNPIPIIGLTAHAQGKVREDCMLAGMNDVFSKPMNLITLETIKSCYLVHCTSHSQSPGYGPEGKLGLDLPDTEQELFGIGDYPLFDALLAFKLVGNNKLLLINVLHDFIKDTPSDIALIQEAYLQKNWPLIERLAHKLKGGVEYCGAPQMKFACQYLERYHKAGHWLKLDQLYHQLIFVANNTQSTINEWLKKNGSV